LSKQNVSGKKKATFLGGSVGGVAVASSNHVNIVIGARRKNFRDIERFFSLTKKASKQKTNSTRIRR
jgi:hypothetical protein